MRVQFNAKTYAVQPPYRDDNAGLWAPDEDTPPPEDAEAVVVESVRVRQSDTDSPDRQRENDTPEPETGRARPADDRDAGIPVAKYPEYDYQAARDRPDWTTVVEHPPRLGDPRFAAEVLDRHADLARRIKALVSAARVGRPVRVRRQSEGETLDLDACIDAHAALRAGTMPDARVYQVMARRSRDLAVSVLLDISQSTADPVAGGTTVLELERDAVIMLAEAMAGLVIHLPLRPSAPTGGRSCAITASRSSVNPPAPASARRWLGSSPATPHASARRCAMPARGCRASRASGG